jgi:hypothetical protein
MYHGYIRLNRTLAYAALDPRSEGLAGIDQETLAAKAGVTRQAVIKIVSDESGKMASMPQGPSIPAACFRGRLRHRIFSGV